MEKNIRARNGVMRARAMHHFAWFALSLYLSVSISSLSLFFSFQTICTITTLRVVFVKRLIRFITAITVCLTDMFVFIITAVGF